LQGWQYDLLLAIKKLKRKRTMSKFFNSKRKNLIQKEGRIKKYLKYAFGEIILTMISILLAVQVNNWNENRIERNEIQTIISNLGDEFTQNKQNIKFKIKELSAAFNNAKNLIELVGKKEYELKKHNIDSLLAISFKYKKFNPSEDVISALLQSGSLKLLKENSIKDLLFQWSSNNTYLHQHFGDLHESTSKALSYLTKNYSLKNFDLYSNEKLTGKSNLKTNKFAIFQDIVFENLLENQIYYSYGYLKSLKETEKIIDSIILFSEKE
jgi:hypothetical protein